jgi:hypothetical protein
VWPGEERFDIVEVAVALREAGKTALFAVLGEYSDYQAEMGDAVGL